MANLDLKILRGLDESLFLKCSEFLKNRISECYTFGGHIKPNYEQRKCFHCYERLNYPAPRTEAIIKQKGNLSRKEASKMVELMREEIKLIKKFDFYRGVLAIISSLKEEDN